MRAMSTIARVPIERVRELLSYDPISGEFIWIAGRKKGRAAGHINKRGYQMIWIDGFDVQAHRLAWFYIHGVWPDGPLDHCNRARADNRIANLRLATHSQNGANKIGACRRPKGTTFDRCVGKWQAQIRKNRKVIYLGIFDTQEEAHIAYWTAAKEFHGEFARAE